MRLFEVFGDHAHAGTRVSGGILTGRGSTGIPDDVWQSFAQCHAKAA